jgi:hypothetical protein
MKSNRVMLAAFAAMTIVSLATAPSVFAQDKMGKMSDSKMSHSKMSDKMGKMSHMAPVYVCKECKMGFTASQAKMMKMKDPMGHPMTKMDKLPTGYKMASKMDKMGDKMGSKMSDKMGDKMGKKPGM